jgi:hypothetical protein
MISEPWLGSGRLHILEVLALLERRERESMCKIPLEPGDLKT